MSTAPNLAEVPRSFRIGEWLVLPELNRIERNGELIDVQPRLMSVLEELARAPGTVVTRDDFHRSIWRDVAVSDDSLNRCITQLRRILGDDPRRPRFIETISKKGYRLVAGVTRPAAPPPAHPVTPVDADLVVTEARVLGYEARIHLRGTPAGNVRGGMVLVNGMLVLVEEQAGNPDGSAETAIAVRTRSYWAAAPFWLGPLSLIISTLLLCGHALGVGFIAGLVLLVTLLGTLAGTAIRSRALADARSALRTLASSMQRR